MKIEKEMRFLNIDKTDLEKRLALAGAKCVFSGARQCRYVYDFHPKDDNKWIRLRTNGFETTLTIKHVVDQTINGTKEWEIQVSDFDETYEMLKMMGYEPRAKQENIRSRFLLDNVEIDIDKWPGIPAFVELEGDDENDIQLVVKKLGLDNYQSTTQDVTTIYREVYGVDVLKMKDLSFANLPDDVETKT